MRSEMGLIAIILIIVWILDHHYGKTVFLEYISMYWHHFKYFHLQEIVTWVLSDNGKSEFRWHWIMGRDSKDKAKVEVCALWALLLQICLKCLALKNKLVRFVMKKKSAAQWTRMQQKQWFIMNPTFHTDEWLENIFHLEDAHSVFWW